MSESITVDPRIAGTGRLERRTGSDYNTPSATRQAPLGAHTPNEYDVAQNIQSNPRIIAVSEERNATCGDCLRSSVTAAGIGGVGLYNSALTHAADIAVPAASLAAATTLAHRFPWPTGTSGAAVGLRVSDNVYTGFNVRELSPAKAALAGAAFMALAKIPGGAWDFWKNTYRISAHTKRRSPEFEQLRHSVTAVIGPQAYAACVKVAQNPELPTLAELQTQCIEDSRERREEILNRMHGVAPTEQRMDRRSEAIASSSSSSTVDQPLRPDLPPEAIVSAADEADNVKSIFKRLTSVLGPHSRYDANRPSTAAEREALDAGKTAVNILCNEIGPVERAVAERPSISRAWRSSQQELGQTYAALNAIGLRRRKAATSRITAASTHNMQLHTNELFNA